MDEQCEYGDCVSEDGYGTCEGCGHPMSVDHSPVSVRSTCEDAPCCGCCS